MVAQEAVSLPPNPAGRGTLARSPLKAKRANGPVSGLHGPRHPTLTVGETTGRPERPFRPRSPGRPPPPGMAFPRTRPSTQPRKQTDVSHTRRAREESWVLFALAPRRARGYPGGALLRRARDAAARSPEPCCGQKAARFWRPTGKAVPRLSP